MKKGLLGLITICLFHAGACQSMTALRRAGASTRAAANRGYQNARS